MGCNLSNQTQAKQRKVVQITQYEIGMLTITIVDLCTKRINDYENQIQYYRSQIAQKDKSRQGNYHYIT